MKESAASQEESRSPANSRLPYSSYLARFFGVVFNGQTYRNLLYLFLAFPLGLIYFIFLVIGFALGLALLIVWVGLLILPVVGLGWWACAAFERKLAIWLLSADIPPMRSQESANRRKANGGLWDKVLEHLANPVTWKSLVFLFAKFPLGILTFVVLVTLISLAGVFLTAPLTYNFLELQIWFTWDLVWQIDTLGEALLVTFLGAWMLIISLHILNGMAWLWGFFARLMLGNYQGISAAPEIKEAG